MYSLLKEHQVASRFGHMRSLIYCKNQNILSGHENGHVVEWSLPEFNVVHEEIIHKGSVMCFLEDVAENSKLDSFELSIDSNFTASFLSCSSDHSIVWTHPNKPTKSFKGHNGPVNSLTWIFPKSINYNKLLLCSGSWDSTARIWKPDTAECLHVLYGHAYAVTVYGLPSGRQEFMNSYCLVTGSQNGCLHIWSDTNNQFQEPTRSFNLHKDIIRRVVSIGSTLYTCSNDSTVRSIQFKKSLNANKTEFSEKLCTKSPTETFFFDVMSVDNDQSLAISTDDGIVLILDLSSLLVVSKLVHATSVWQTVELENSDLVTICSDGCIRVWTKDVSRKGLTPEFSTELKEQTVDNLATNSSNPSLEPDKDVPLITELNNFRGKTKGAVKLFREGNNIKAFSWNGKSWDLVGDVTGFCENNTVNSNSEPKGYYPGDKLFEPGLYDYIFDVECNPGDPLKKLPFRVDDDTAQVVEKFCKRENINNHIKQAEVLTFLNRYAKPNKKKKTEVAEGKTISSSSVLKGVEVVLNEELKKNHFPLKKYIRFEKVQLDKLKDAILKNADEVLSDLDRDYLKVLFDKLASPYVKSKTFRQCEMDVVFGKKLSSLPQAKLLPVIDLWRVVALHHQISDLHKSSDGGWHYIAYALNLASAVSGSTETLESRLEMLCLRYISNLHQHSTTACVLLKFTLHVLELLPKCAATDPEGTRHAWSSVLVNFSVSACLIVNSSPFAPSEFVPIEVIQKTLAKYVSLITEGIQCWKEDAKTTYMLVTAIGTLVNVRTHESVLNDIPNCKESLISTLQKIVCNSDEDLTSSVNDVLSILVR